MSSLEAAIDRHTGPDADPEEEVPVVEIHKQVWIFRNILLDSWKLNNPWVEPFFNNQDCNAGESPHQIGKERPIILGRYNNMGLRICNDCARKYGLIDGETPTPPPPHTP